MKIRDLEEQELRQRIMKQISTKLWFEAIEIFYNSKEYKKYKKNHRIKSWFEGYVESKFYNSIKEIQMKLLDNEVKDANVGNQDAKEVENE